MVKASRGVRERAGSVLILALWALFFLAALALSVGAHVSSSLGLAEAMMKRVRAYSLATAGVARTAAFIAANTNSWDGLSQDAWNNSAVFKDNAELADGVFSVVYVQTTREDEEAYRHGVIGEERCISIAPGKLSRNLLVALLHHVGGESVTRSGEIADAIIEWTEPRDRRLTGKRESDYYRDLELPYRKHGGSFQSVYELLLVKGIDEDLFERIRPFVTMYGSGDVNVNIAPREVLLCVAVVALTRGRSENRAFLREAERVVDEIVRVRPKRTVSDFREDLSEEGKQAFGSMEGMLSVSSTCFGGIAIGKVGRSRAESDGTDDTGVTEARISFVLDAGGTEQYWHEH